MIAILETKRRYDCLPYLQYIRSLIKQNVKTVFNTSVDHGNVNKWSDDFNIVLDFNSFLFFHNIFKYF